MGSFSYTSHACFLFLWGVCLTHPELGFLSVSLFNVMIFFSFFIWGVSLTHPALALFFYGEFLLHIPGLFDSSVGSFSYTSHFFLFFFPFFCFNLGSFSYTSRAGFIFMRGVSLKHPVLALFFYGEFLLHIPCLFDFSVGSFSYTSHAGLCVCVCVGVGVCVGGWVGVKERTKNEK